MPPPFGVRQSWAIALARAVDRALAIGALTVEAVRLLLQDGREEPAKYFRLDGHPHLQGHVIPPPNLAVYDALRQEGARHEEA